MLRQVVQVELAYVQKIGLSRVEVMVLNIVCISSNNRSQVTSLSHTLFLILALDGGTMTKKCYKVIAVATTLARADWFG